jgi:betaine-aldehyde dehydrogenase
MNVITPELPPDDLSRQLRPLGGQYCEAGSRVIVQRAIYEKVRDALAEELRQVRVGPASDPDTELGL